MTGKKPEIQKTEKTSKYPGFDTAMNEMSGMAPGLAGKLGEAYGGDRTAQMDPLQQAAYQKFSQYMNSGGSGNYMNDPQYQQAKGLRGDVLGGKYLEQDNPLVDYTRNKLMTEQVPDAMEQARRRQSIRGNYYSKAAVDQETDIMDNANDAMAGVYANQYGGELNRQMGMIDPAMRTAQTEGQVPMTDINQMIQMGEFPRQLEQQEMDTQYNEWLRQRSEQMTPLNMAPKGSQMYPEYDYNMTEGEPSAFESWINPALQIGSLAAAPFTGGASLAAMPWLQGAGQAFGTEGVDPGGFANFTNAFAPMASMAMGGMNFGGAASGAGGAGIGNLQDYLVTPENLFPNRGY